MRRSRPPSLRRAAAIPPALVETIADDLAGRGWSIVPGFFEPALVRALRADARQTLAAAGRGAAIGRGRARQLDRTVRGDRICWLEPPMLTPAQATWWARVEALMGHLGRALRVPLAELEAFVAEYPPGAGYDRHVDRFRDAFERVVSCTSYLNPRWRPADGGALRIWEPGGAAYEDVPPRGGTLVVFRSEDIEHAVLPAIRPRYSMTGWMRVRRPGPLG